jgi:hypothetical protein
MDVHMKRLPKTDRSLVLRTDFSNDSAWDSICTAIQEISEDGFCASVDCINDPAYDALTVEQLVILAAESETCSFAFLVDQIALTHPDRPILVVDLYEQPGRTFRVIPREMWSVENNLSIANMDYSDFAENVDQDGIFRGFLKP